MAEPATAIECVDRDDHSTPTRHTVTRHTRCGFENPHRTYITVPFIDAVDCDHLLDLADQEVMRTKRYGRPCTMAVFDPDNWAAYTHEHAAWTVDDALSVIAVLTGQVVRVVDVVARIHDEAFAVLLPETPVAGGLCVGERLCWALDGVRLTGDGDKLPLTLSVGVAEVHDDTLTASELFARAVAARDLARLQGGNRVMIA